MFRDMLHVLWGAFLWNLLQLRYGISYKKVVLVLTGENRDLDFQALIHLGDYMHIKHTSKAIVLYSARETGQMAEDMRIDCLGEHAVEGSEAAWGAGKKVMLHQCSRKTMETVYDYYSFHKFFDSIVFTYTSRPVDNLLGRLLKETEVDEEEAVCLGLYRLRSVPAGKRQGISESLFRKDGGSVCRRERAGGPEDV